MPLEHFSPTLPFAVSEGAFTPSELDRIEAIGDALTLDKAVLLGSVPDEEYSHIRVTSTAWIKPATDTKWIYERMQAVIRTLNDRVWQFDLRGFADDFQYTVYHGTEGGHYDWHVDQGDFAKPRKLSLSLQLTDPSEYEGCELQLQGTRRIETTPRERGTLVAFPSYVLHRVTPITSGIRKAVVVWTTGPKFR